MNKIDRMFDDGWERMIREVIKDVEPTVVNVRFATDEDLKLLTDALEGEVKKVEGGV